MDYDDVVESWQHTKDYAGKNRNTATMLRSGGMRVTSVWVPLTRRSQWAEAENVWFDEMDELYSTD